MVPVQDCIVTVMLPYPANEHFIHDRESQVRYVRWPDRFVLDFIREHGTYLSTYLVQYGTLLKVSVLNEFQYFLTFYLINIIIYVR